MAGRGTAGDAIRSRITKRSVEAVQPIEGKDVLLFDTQIADFAVRVTPEGSRIYLLQYEVAGRKRRYRIGKHGEMTAEEARERARRFRVQVSNGHDPFAEREEDRAIRDVAALGERYMTEHALVHKRASSAAEDRRNLDNHIVPLLGHLKASAVTAEDVARMVRGIAAGDTARDQKTEHGRRIVKGGKIAANRARALLSTMMNLAETWGYRSRNSNPCGGVRRFLEEKRQRFRTGDELARLGRTLAAAETEGLDRPAGENRPARKVNENPATIAAIRLLLFTGCRLSEIRTLKWSHVDTGRAMLNLPISKTGAEPVFLSAPALQVLAGLKRPEDATDAFVFPALGQRRRVPSRCGRSSNDKTRSRRVNPPRRERSTITRDMSARMAQLLRWGNDRARGVAARQACRRREFPKMTIDAIVSAAPMWTTRRRLPTPASRTGLASLDTCRDCGYPVSHGKRGIRMA